MDRKRFVPELNYWIDNILSNKSPIKDKFYKYPVPVSSDWRDPNTILELLFNETYQSPFDDSSSSSSILPSSSEDSSSSENGPKFPDDLVYQYRIITLDYINDYSIVNRSSIYAGYLDIYIAAYGPGSYENIFNITDEEKTLLARLYQYKSFNNTTISGLNFEELESSLSKCIYVFLDCELNSNYNSYDKSFPISDGSNLLHSAYEKYIIDYIYRIYSKSYGITYHIPEIVGNKIIKINEDNFFILQTEILLTKLTADEISNKKVEFPSTKKPWAIKDIVVIYDGRQLAYNTDYSIVINNDDVTDIDVYITWTHNSFNVDKELLLIWSYAEPYSLAYDLEN